MAATCGANFARVLLVLYNILFFITGAVLIGVGSYMIASPSITTPVETVGDVFGGSYLRVAAIILISMGVFIVVFTILGIYAAISENTIALSIYIAFLVIFCFLEIAAGVIAIVFKDQLLEKMQKGMFQTLRKVHTDTGGSYYKDSTCDTIDVAKAWDFFQYNGECCGVNGKEDYELLQFNFDTSARCSFNQTKHKSVPWSCCTKLSAHTFDGEPSKEKVDCSLDYSPKGCYIKLYEMVLTYAPVLIGLGLGFGFLQLFGIIFAVCVCQNPSKDY